MMTIFFPKRVVKLSDELPRTLLLAHHLFDDPVPPPPGLSEGSFVRPAPCRPPELQSCGDCGDQQRRRASRSSCSRIVSAATASVAGAIDAEGCGSVPDAVRSRFMVSEATPARCQREDSDKKDAMPVLSAPAAVAPPKCRRGSAGPASTPKPGEPRHLRPRPGGFAVEHSRAMRHLEDLNSIDDSLPGFKRCDVAQGACALELFAGASRLSCNMRKCNVRTCVPMDIRYGVCFDLTRRSCQLQLLKWIRDKKFSYIHMGTPCRAWSIARKGIRNLRKACAIEDLCLELALLTYEICKTCQECGVMFSVENPSSSRLWEFEPFVRMSAWSGVFKVQYDSCAFGASSKKPTVLLTNAKCLMSLQKRCPGCSSSHRHVALSGSARVLCADGRWRWLSRTKMAGAYSHGLSKAWAKAISRAVPRDDATVPPALSLDEIAQKLHAGLSGASRPSLSEVKTSVADAHKALHRKLLPDGVAEADLYDLNDASAEAGATSSGAAKRFLRRHVVRFGGARVRGQAHSSTKTEA